MSLYDKLSTTKVLFLVNAWAIFVAPKEPIEQLDKFNL
jgi:hypothetical protein